MCTALCKDAKKKKKRSYFELWNNTEQSCLLNYPQEVQTWPDGAIKKTKKKQQPDLSHLAHRPRRKNRYQTRWKKIIIKNSGDRIKNKNKKKVVLSSTMQPWISRIPDNLPASPLPFSGIIDEGKWMKREQPMLQSISVFPIALLLCDAYVYAHKEGSIWARISHWDAIADDASRNGAHCCLLENDGKRERLLAL